MWPRWKQPGTRRVRELCAPDCANCVRNEPTSEARVGCGESANRIGSEADCSRIVIYAALF